MEFAACQGLAVPPEIMHHVVRVESSYNPFAIGVVGGRLARQPRNLPEALSTVRMLESRGFNFSLGLAQVNRYNLGKYGLDSYEEAFETCANLQAGAKILAECYHRAGRNWGKSFSCYYSGNFSTGFRHGYVQKIYASVRKSRGSVEAPSAPAIAVMSRGERRMVPLSRMPLYSSTDTSAIAGNSSKDLQPTRAHVMRSRIADTSPMVAAVQPAGLTDSPQEIPIDPDNRSMSADVDRAMGKAVIIDPAGKPAQQLSAAQRRITVDKARIADGPEEDAAFVF